MPTLLERAGTLATDARALEGSLRSQSAATPAEWGTASERTALAAYETERAALAAGDLPAAVLAGLGRLASGFTRISAVLADITPAPDPDAPDNTYSATRYLILGL